ncbi:hypothetical protein K431DRAFT_299118 [Polychaeton citri CBS 116435]|uniref:Secreted protein n=1 Tax=Polychaeton citri CBS 116435 TaxID=1314669 RepID=A0A9P4UKF9_9PEZI|nr:hypothetical protein K431DRAFT_299118 [Polychaeton citri CBS 116435]
MKYSPLTSLVVVFVFLVSQIVAGSIENLPVSTKTRSRMTLSDSFSNSGMEYMDWANKMVAEGKMRWPDKRQNDVVAIRNSTRVSLVRRQPTGFNLQNVVCGYVEGRLDQYSQANTTFCQFIGNSYALDAQLILGYEIFKGALCDDVMDGEDEDCILQAQLASKTAGYIADIVNYAICGALFEDLNSYCSGATGGSAQVVINDSNGTSLQGNIEMQFYENDSTATCPAPSAATTCAATSF